MGLNSSNSQSYSQKEGRKSRNKKGHSPRDMGLTVETPLSPAQRESRQSQCSAPTPRHEAHSCSSPFYCYCSTNSPRIYKKTLTISTKIKVINAAGIVLDTSRTSKGSPSQITHHVCLEQAITPETAMGGRGTEEPEHSQVRSKTLTETTTILLFSEQQSAGSRYSHGTGVVPSIFGTRGT